jgi:hypothetical protein
VSFYLQLCSVCGDRFAESAGLLLPCRAHESWNAAGVVQPHCRASAAERHKTAAGHEMRTKTLLANQLTADVCDAVRHQGDDTDRIGAHNHLPLLPFALGLHDTKLPLCGRTAETMLDSPSHSC